MNYKTEMIDGLLHAISDIRPGRAVGNTTRQVNDTIDLFLSLPTGQKHVGFKDHWGNWHADEYMQNRIIRRLRTETQYNVYLKKPDELPNVQSVLVGKNFIKAINF